MGNYESATLDLSMSADLEGDDADKAVATIEQQLDRELERWTKAANKPTGTIKKSKPAAKAKEPDRETVPATVSKAEEKADLDLGDEPASAPVTMDDVRASLRQLNEKAGREHVKALLDEFSDDGKLPGVPEKNYKELFLKSEEALANMDDAQ